MSNALRGMRLQIAILGRCNTGKSTILNRIAGQEAALVAETPGTTGDPVPLAFELLPLGPVTLYDTAGLDEISTLGALRREAGLAVLGRADMAVVVTDGQGLGPLENDLMDRLRGLKTPFLVIFNKQGLAKAPATDTAACRAASIPFLELEDGRSADPALLRQALLDLAPALEADPPLLTDLVPEKGVVICVTPIDSSAPKGRLIAPQVQALRELMEEHRLAMVVQDGELADALSALAAPPALVVTDSQVVKRVVEILPPSVPMTTFSLLFSRLKGDFALQYEGASRIASLPPGAKVLVAESCSHHPQEDDIARVKIPRLMQKFLGHELRFAFFAGRDFPADLASYSLVLHCGGCMLNRREMRRRLALCAENGVPVTNYGMVISATQGVLERAAAPILRAGKG